MSSMRRVLVTGCAGFLGSHLSERLVERGDNVVGIDCFTDYYARQVKESNLSALVGDPRFEVLELDLSRDRLDAALEGVTEVYHLAAQAGVRGSFGESFENYVRNNIQGTQRLLEAASRRELDCFVYASSSSVYGDAAIRPTPEDHAPAPISPYGITKLATEHLASVYHVKVGMPVVGLRFFTAYGPRQRPDMAFHRFISRALTGRAISILGDGHQRRDFTYVHDVVQAILLAGSRGGRGAVYNIGGGTPVELLDVLEILSNIVGRPLELRFQPAAAGDPLVTHAENSRAAADLGFVPATPVGVGLPAQCAWMESRLHADPLLAAPKHRNYRRPAQEAKRQAKLSSAAKSVDT
jgi:nucleoside-diphosphate-sugar epimerase